MSTRRIVASAAILVVTLAVAVFVTLFTSAMVTARADPEGALARWPVDAAKAGVATKLLADTPSRQDVDRGAALTEMVLVRNPVNAEAARDLAMAWLARGNLSRARSIIAAGEGLSRRDVPTQTWLIEDRVQAGDVAGALAHYDRALRVSPETRDVLMPVLAQAANDPAIARSLIPRLRVRPEWWSDFLGRFIAAATSPMSIRIVAEGLQLNPANDIDRERLEQIFDRLIKLGDYSAARSLRDHAAGRAPLVVNGGFEDNQGLAPFNWQLVDETDRSAVREMRDGARGNALSIGGTEGKEVARQFLALAPGRYRLQVTSGAVAVGTLAPPVISIQCVGQDAGLAGTASLPQGEAARRWSSAFTIPSGCRGQWLTIASASNVGYLAESPWIDDIVVTLDAGAGARAAGVSGSAR